MERKSNCTNVNKINISKTERVNFYTSNSTQPIFERPGAHVSQERASNEFEFKYGRHKDDDDEDNNDDDDDIDDINQGKKQSIAIIECNILLVVGLAGNRDSKSVVNIDTKSYETYEEIAAPEIYLRQNAGSAVIFEFGSSTILSLHIALTMFGYFKLGHSVVKPPVDRLEERKIFANF